MSSPLGFLAITQSIHGDLPTWFGHINLQKQRYTISDPLKEYHNLLEKYGLETAEWLMDEQYQNYKRLVLIAHTQEDLEAYRPRALEVAKYCEQWGMVYGELVGSDAYLHGLVAAIGTVTESNDDFLLVPPGETLQQGQFIRLQI